MSRGYSIQGLIKGSKLDFKLYVKESMTKEPLVQEMIVYKILEKLEYGPKNLFKLILAKEMNVSSVFSTIQK